MVSKLVTKKAVFLTTGATVLVRAILQNHGKCFLDYFKITDDKSFLFSKSRNAFLAYKVSAGFAIALGDPVGPVEEMRDLVDGFEDFCKENKLEPIFFQTKGIINNSRRTSYEKLKIGDEAIVDLEKFSTAGKKNRELRYKLNKLGKEGFKLKFYKANFVPSNVLEEIEEISNSWLKIHGKTERYFSLGHFTKDYVKSTDIFVLYDKYDKAIAFANLVPVAKAGHYAIDLMRRRHDCPNGVMDFLFIKLLLELKEREFKKVSLGLSPMSGFKKYESPSIVEKFIHAAFKRMNFIFNYRGLKIFKSKFATSWEPRYLNFKHYRKLPQLCFAINQALNGK